MKTSFLCVTAFGCALAVVSLFPCKVRAQDSSRQFNPPQTKYSVLEGPAIQKLITEPLSQQDLRKLVTSARTVQDHPNLAQYYRSKAHRMNMRAENYARFARVFGDRVPAGGDRHFSVGRMAFYYRTAADESLSRARTDKLLGALNAQARQKEGCFTCHSFHGHGGKIAPDLAAEGTRGRSEAWLTAHFKDPQAVSKNSVMPSFGHLKPHQLEVLSAFLQHQK